MKYKTLKNISKSLSVILSISLILVLSLSFIYIVKETNHSCEGENCSICLSLKQCDENIRLKGGSPDTPLRLGITVNFVLLCFAAVKSDVLIDTLISQKVRLND